MNEIRPWRTIHRRQSRQIMVGNVPVGGDAPITVQTMTNTPTEDAVATIDQIRRCEDAGADIIRVTCPTAEATAAMPAMNRAPGANFVHLSGPPADEGDTHGPGVTRSRNIKRRPANGTFVTERRGIGMVVASWIIARASSSFARCRKTPVYAG